jgi:hypothetical protein
MHCPQALLQTATVVMARKARVAAMLLIVHPFVLRIDGRNKTSPIITINAKNNNCCRL